MKIVRFNAGLGNQMFQYIFYECLKLHYPNEIINADLSLYEKHNPHNGFELDKIFNIQLTFANKNDVQQLIDDKKYWHHRIRRKIFGTKKSYYKEKILGFDEKTFNLNTDVLFQGYWISWKYCDLLNISVHSLFQFEPLLDDKNSNILAQIKNSESVSIHIRRGDYYSSSAIKSHGNIATLEYYQKAITIFEKNMKNPTFFIFSDDPNWVKNNLKIKNAIIVTNNKEQNAYRDMQLMSLCKHQIIANSTFSWWGAFLNKNTNKIVICPKKWFNKNTIPHKIEDILPSEWIKI